MGEGRILDTNVTAPGCQNPCDRATIGRRKDAFSQEIFINIKNEIMAKIDVKAEFLTQKCHCARVSESVRPRDHRSQEGRILTGNFYQHQKKIMTKSDVKAEFLTQMSLRQGV